MKKKLTPLLLSPLAYLVMNVIGGGAVYAAEVEVSCYADSANNSFHCGNGSTASDTSSMAIGTSVSTSGVRAIAIGAPDSSSPSVIRHTTATSDGIAIGSGATVAKDGVGGIAIGSRRHDPKTGTAINGNLDGGATVNAINGIAIGTGATSGIAGQNDFRSIAIGDLTTVMGSLNTGIGAGLVMGSSSARSVAMGYGAAVGRSAPGSDSFLAAIGATAVGSGAQVMKDSNYSTSLGYNAVVQQGTIQSLALGNYATVGTASAYSTAIGTNAVVGSGAENSIALGGGSTATGSARVTTSGSIAVGSGTLVQSENAVALGKDSTVETGLTGGVALGSNSIARAAVPVSSADVGEIHYGDYAGNTPAVGDVVSMGATGKERQIQNVAAGQISAASTDAINGSQLYATSTRLGNIANSTKSLLGGDAAVSPDGKISMSNVGGTGATTVNDAIMTVSETANKGWKINSGRSGTGKVIGAAPARVSPGDTVKFVAGDNVRLTQSGSDITVAVDNVVTYTSDARDMVTLGGPSVKATPDVDGNMVMTGGSKITNVASAGDYTDARNADSAINAGDLNNAVMDVTNKGLRFSGNEGATLSRRLGDSLTIKGEAHSLGAYSAANIKTLTDPATGSIVIQLADSPRFGDITVNDGGKITGLVNGTVEPGSQDAVSGDQLYATRQAAAGVLGGGASVAADGNITAPSYSVYGVKVSNVGDALTSMQNRGPVTYVDSTGNPTTIPGNSVALRAADNSVTTPVELSNVASGTGGKAVGDLTPDELLAMGNNAVNVNDLKNVTAVASTGWNISAQGAGTSNVKPGADVDLRNEDGNIVISKTADNNDVTFALNRELNLDKVNMVSPEGTATSLSGDGVHITPASGGAPVSLTSLGLDNGGKTLRNVGDGAVSADSNDAINGKQLYNTVKGMENLVGGTTVYDSATGSFTSPDLGGTGKSTINDAIAAVNSSVTRARSTVSEGDNIRVNERVNPDGSMNYTVATARDVSFDRVDVGPVSIVRDNGISAGNTVISGIKSGSAPSDAVNVSQLIRVVNAIGGGAKINSEGALTGPEYTVVTTDGQHRTLTDAGQALTALNEEVNKPMIFEGDEGTHSVRLGSTMKIKGDGKGITTVVSGDTLTVRMGGTQTPDHVVVNQSLSLAKEANVDMGGNIIHNVGAGKAPGDAVNYGQLQQAFGGLDKRINRVARRADAGAAAAIATAGLTQAYLPGKSMMSMSGGSFQGQNSLAIGLSTISDNGKWVMKGAFTTTTQSQTGASVGIGYQF
ncbi:hypothetical protein GE706_22390 [Salmonella enterica]|nr:hypothetical protein [Salmonella enterica]